MPRAAIAQARRLITALMFAATVASCRCEDEHARELQPLSVPAQRTGASLQITPLPALVLPIRGRIADLVALDDGGYVVADEHRALTIRRIDASLVQTWEYTLDGYPSNTFHFRDLVVADDAVWVALTLNRSMTIEGKKLTAIGPIPTYGPMGDPDLLLLEFSLTSGVLRAFRQLGDHADVGPTQIAYHRDTLYITSATAPAWRQGELDWGEPPRSHDRDGVIVVALHTNGAYKWRKRFATSWAPSAILADEQGVAVAGSSGRDFEVDGHEVTGSQSLWIAELGHDGTLHRLEKLYSPEYWLNVLPIGEGELGYLMGGGPPTFGVWNDQAGQFAANELPCGNCRAEAGWRVGARTILITSDDDAVHIDLVSAGGAVLASELIESPNPVMPSYITVRGRDDVREIVIWRWWTNVVVRARVAISP